MAEITPEQMQQQLIQQQQQLAMQREALARTERPLTDIGLVQRQAYMSQLQQAQQQSTLAQEQLQAQISNPQYQALKNLQSLGAETKDIYGGTFMYYSPEALAIAQATGSQPSAIQNRLLSGEIKVQDGQIFYKGVSLGSSAQIQQYAQQIEVARQQQSPGTFTGNIQTGIYTTSTGEVRQATGQGSQSISNYYQSQLPKGEKPVLDSKGNLVGVESSILHQSISIDNYQKALQQYTTGQNNLSYLKSLASPVDVKAYFTAIANQPKQVIQEKQLLLEVTPTLTQEQLFKQNVESLGYLTAGYLYGKGYISELSSLGTKGYGEGIYGFPAGAISGGLDVLYTGGLILSAPFEIAQFKVPRIITSTGELIKKAFTTGFPEISDILLEKPGYSLGYVAGSYYGGKATSKIADFTFEKFTALSPKYSPVVKNVLGEQMIPGLKLNLKMEKDILLIPDRSRPLEPEPLKAVEIYGKDIPLREIPKIPEPLTPIQQDIISIAKARQDILSGSFMQQTLLREGYARPFADIDILSRDPQLTADVIAGTRNDIVVIKKTITDSPLGKFDIYKIQEKSTGKSIADIDPIEFAEEKFATKFGSVDVQGYKFLAPEARLASKIVQIARKKFGTENKVVTDITGLTGGELVPDITSPSFKGAFGNTLAELKAYEGLRGDITSSARGLFGFIFKRKVEISATDPYGFFATPFDIKTGLPQTRISRLGVGSMDASILDLVSGDISFVRQKPQIVIFKDQLIGKDFLVTAKSSELEVNLPPGYVIRRVRTQGVTQILGKRVPIIEAEIVKATPSELALKRAIETAKVDELKPLLDKLAKETGIDYTQALNQKYVSPYRLASNLRTINYNKVSSKSFEPTYKISKSITSPTYTQKYSPSKYSPQRYAEPKYTSPLYVEPRYTTPKYPSYESPRYERPRYSTPNYPPYLYPNKPRPPIRLPISEDKKRKQKRKLIQLYNLAIRRRGKFQTIRTGLAKGEALRLGADIATRDIARTFKVVASGTKETFGISEADYMPSEKIFRSYIVRKGKKIATPDQFIQRTSANLQSVEEKRQLAEARRLNKLMGI